MRLKKSDIKLLTFKYTIPDYSSKTGQTEKGSNKVTWSGYADDLNLYLATFEDLRKATLLLGTVFEDHELIINYGKTETLILNHHIKDQHQFICEACDENFVEKEHLERHIKTVHTEQITNECHICHKPYKRKCNLIKHLKTVHEIKSETSCNIQCETCEERFVDKKHLTEHIKIVHPKPTRQCHMCQKQYKRDTNLVKHLRSVHKIIPASTSSKNDICNKNYPNSILKINGIDLKNAKNVQVFRNKNTF